jgi:hypothetical protein
MASGSTSAVLTASGPLIQDYVRILALIEYVDALPTLAILKNPGISGVESPLHAPSAVTFVLDNFRAIGRTAPSYIQAFVVPCVFKAQPEVATVRIGPVQALIALSVAIPLDDTSPVILGCAADVHAEP